MIGIPILMIYLILITESIKLKFEQIMNQANPNGRYHLILMLVQMVKKQVIVKIPISVGLYIVDAG